MWLHLAEGLLPACDQPQPSEAATDQPAATPADVLALVGVRAWAEYEADANAVDAVICPPTRTLLALLEVREVWKARRSADSVRLELLDPDAARLLQDECRDAILALPFGDQSQGRAVIQVTVDHSEDREDQATTPLLGLAEAIAATISQRINTPPELQHAQWLTDTMTAAGVEMHHHNTEPTLLRVGDDNRCAISLGQDDEEFADTLRLAVALTSHVALLRAIRLRTIVIYLTKSEFDPSELLIHPFSQTIREAGELGGNIGHNHIRRAAKGLRMKAQKTAPASLALRAAGRPVYTLTLQLTAHDHSIIVLSCQSPAIAAELASLSAESHQLRNPQRLSIQLEHHPSQATPAGKGKAATSAKHKKKQPMGRSRSDGATRNRSRSKPRLSGTHGSDSELETVDTAAHPSSSSHQ
eukprot:jgi/Tetstr1/454557/TSEL_041453.t1